ncbi:MAG: hypothetical protein J3K34DRAFT_525991 [Monoraphidium minutum]|nr:MAG: hypothetical protein J3K34DRAFT_525991 [Monoraphidium minutum]
MLQSFRAGVCRDLRRRAGGAARHGAGRAVQQLPATAQRASGGGSGSALRAMQIADHAAYLEEVSVLQAQGHPILSPSDRAGLHPLLIPLASCPAAGGPDASAPAGAESVVVGLLRWADPGRHKGMTLPVVSMSRGARGVRLLARSVDEYLHRILAEEDAAAGSGGTTPLADAASAAAAVEVAELYPRGAVERSGLTGPKFNLYLIKKVGMHPDVAEALSLGHLGRGDATSAMVAGEWYMRNGHFPGWARPYEFCADLYRKIGKREEECRDVARMALRSPWWTLSSYEDTVAMAQLSGTPEEVRWILSEEATAQRTGAVTGLNYKEPRTPVELAMEEADAVMDMVAGGSLEGGFDAAREALAAAYEKAGLIDAANFIRAA